jgi:hypothetical protein
MYQNQAFGLVLDHFVSYLLASLKASILGLQLLFFIIVALSFVMYSGKF